VRVLEDGAVEGVEHRLVHREQRDLVLDLEAVAALEVDDVDGAARRDSFAQLRQPPRGGVELDSSSPAPPPSAQRSTTRARMVQRNVDLLGTRRLRSWAVPLSLRVARPGDGAALVALHEEMGRYYAELAPEQFRRPDVDGLARDLDGELGESSDDELVLVAQADGQIVGALWAALLQPPADAARQIERDVTRVRVRIDYVVTSADRRRQGVAARLVEAAEAWGRAHGAAVAEASTYRASPLSFPFWTRRMGYAERTVNLRKRLP
jgi:GNAT superfamily N-acetyltransferase